MQRIPIEVRPEVIQSLKEKDIRLLKNKTKCAALLQELLDKLNNNKIK